MEFPAKGSKRSIFSLFTTTTTFVDENNGTSFKYAFWPEYARNFDEEDCKTYQPNFLCRRVNLAPTELKILMSYKYNMYIIATLCLTASSTIYNGLKMLTRHGPKIYDFIKINVVVEKLENQICHHAYYKQRRPTLQAWTCCQILWRSVITTANNPCMYFV